ncbi:LRAT-like domain-containing protein [Strongyloides ratti]|uniref:LRAT-like domain-containing protein n=1 Tax=Strongyloides ratti TaxID=34506 RepID=A0A090KWT1_STRRB|nr:LRAT-like domain-containing protein [Strongyloides ratti]CEF61881.1 LRAT-like domain-containing protein [Strongyloides ratti]
MIKILLIFLSFSTFGFGFKNHLGWLNNKTLEFDDSFYTDEEIIKAYRRIIKTDITNPVNLKKFLKPGDMIEFDNTILGGSVPYSHWGIFLGIIENKHIIIHVARESNYIKFNDGDEKKSRFNGMKAKINNFLDQAIIPNSVKAIRRNAIKALDRDAKYDLVQNNCEHFATELRYGIKVSMQVESRFIFLNSISILFCIGLTLWVNKMKSERILKEIQKEVNKKL